MDLGDPRLKSNRYFKGASVKFINKKFDLSSTQFTIDANYVGEPPEIQVSIENLNDNIDETFLRKYLAKLGQIRTLEIVRHKETKQHLGLAKVEFEDVAVAQSCVDTFNGKQLMGRALLVYKDVRFAIIQKSTIEKLNPIGPPPTLVPGRQRLEDRIAILFKQPNNVLSNIVGSKGVPPPPNPASFSAFTPPTNETLRYDYPNSSYYNRAQTNVPLRALDKNRTEFSHDQLHQHRKLDNRYDDRAYDEEAEDRAWNPVSEPPKPVKAEHPKSVEVEPLELNLTESQITNEVLPFCFEQFVKELQRNLLSTLKKSLVQRHGYKLIDEAQEDHKAREKKKKIDEVMQKMEKRMEEIEQHKKMEKQYLSRERVENTGTVRPRVQLIRTRRDNSDVMQENRRRGDLDLKRVNRSSAVVSGQGRRGIHNTFVHTDSSNSEGSSPSRSSRSSSRSSLFLLKVEFLRFDCK